MRIEVTNIYEDVDFDIIPVCGTGDAGVKQFFELLEDDDILDIFFISLDIVVLSYLMELAIEEKLKPLLIKFSIVFRSSFESCL